MAFDDRLQFLLIGLVIGAVFGYLVRLMQDVKRDVRGVVKDVHVIGQEVHDVKEELDEVDTIVKRIDHDEGGYFKSSFTAIAAILVVGLTVYAAFVSQKASNDVKTSVDRNEIATYCNLTVTSKALNALNERSTYTLSNTQANIDLQTDFAKFFNLLLHQPPYNEVRQLRAAHNYQTSLNNFVYLAGKSKNKIEDNPFPTVDDLVACIEKGEVPGDNLQKYLNKEKN